MIFWILVAIAVIVVLTVAVKFCNDTYYTWGDIIGATLFTAVVSAVVVAIYTLAAGFLITGTMASQRVSSVKTYELQAITNGEDQRGKASAFFLVAAGSWDTEQVFKYLYKDERGAFRLDKVNAEDAYIYEDDVIAPRLVITKYESYDDSGIWLPWEVAKHWGTMREFTVPVGSVLNQYDVGLD